MNPCRTLSPNLRTPDQYPTWVLEEALRRHEWRVSDGPEADWRRDGEFYDRDRCWPFYPQTQKDVYDRPRTT